MWNRINRNVILEALYVFCFESLKFCANSGYIVVLVLRDPSSMGSKVSFECFIIDCIYDLEVR